jgi:hypothetical protein
MSMPPCGWFEDGAMDGSDFPCFSRAKWQKLPEGKLLAAKNTLKGAPRSSSWLKKCQFCGWLTNIIDPKGILKLLCLSPCLLVYGCESCFSKWGYLVSLSNND